MEDTTTCQCVYPDKCFCPKPDAIDQVLALRTGDSFTLRGRTFTVSGWSGVSHYEGRMVLPVWNERGREVRITVKTNDRIG